MQRTQQEPPGIDPRDVASVLVAILLGMEVLAAVGVSLDSKGILHVLDELFPTEPRGMLEGSAKRKPARRSAGKRSRTARSSRS
jgi:hypothetical protein